MKLAARVNTFLILAFATALPAKAQTPIPGKFYEYYIIARTGATFTDLGSGGGPSINDYREVAFRGATAQGNGLWFGTGNTANPVNFNPGESFSSSDIIQPSVQINSNHQVVSEDRIPTTSPASTNIRLYNANAVDSYIYAARGGPFATGKGVYLYPAVFANPATNLNGDVVFTASNPNGGSSKILGVLQHGTTSPIQQTIFSGSPMPMIADDGTVVIQVGGAGTQTNNQVLVYPPGLQSPVVIADTAANWNSLDNAPGVSRDGIVIAFQGNPNAVEAAAIGTTVGPGIFVAVNEGNGWGSAKIIRLTGTEVENVYADRAAGKGNLDGICNLGEICTPTAELGWDEQGNKITIASYPTGSRVGVAHVDFGPPGIDYDTFVVSFVATPSGASRPNPFVPNMPLLFSAQQGLWTIRMDVQKQLDPPNGRVYHAASPIPVVQIGDHLGPDTVTGIAVYDPIANAAHDESGNIRTMRRGDHRMAFWASTNNGQIIVRANHLDSDQDGLLDHWETTGIDMDQDGVVDFQPSLYGADPFHRDLFVQVDQAAGNQYQLQPRVFNFDIPGSYSYFETNFRNAEVWSGAMYGARIDGSPPADIPAGIIPHVDAGAGPDLIGLSPSINLNGQTPRGGQWIEMPGKPGVAPELIYYGAPGSITAPGLNSLALESVKDTYFGSADKDAREFIFHYVAIAPFLDMSPSIFPGDSPSFPPVPYVGSVGFNSGDAEIVEVSGTLPNTITRGMQLRILTGAAAGTLMYIDAVGPDPDTGFPAMSVQKPFPIPPAIGDQFVVFDLTAGLAEGFFFYMGARSAGDNNSLPGNDVILGLRTLGASANGVYGSACEQWQLILHELGHTLGLRHGGTDNLTSFPPNGVKGTAYESLMSYSWDLNCTEPYTVTTYSDSNDKTFDDFANLRMDFSNVMFHMGSSLGYDLGAFSYGDYLSQNPEPNNDLYVAQNGPLDTVAPAVSITSPAANSGVNGSLTVNVTASDNVAIDSVSVLFDVNGNGVMEAGDGVVATSKGGNQYQAVFNGIAGPQGLRPLEVIAWDTATNFTTAVINLDVGGIPLAMVPAVTGFAQAAATTAITNAGLTVGTVTQQSSSTVPGGEVISETPSSGTVVNPGSTVNLVISTGTPLAITGPSSLPVGTVGLAYPGTTVKASGGSGNYSWSATGLPPGLGIGPATGTITGTPTTTTGSPFAAMVTVTDATTASATKSYTVYVNTAAACEVSNSGNPTVSDVQLMINQALGTAHAANDLNGDGAVNVTDVQLVINAVLGFGCSAFY